MTGDHFREVLIALGLTQTQIARLFEVATTTVWRWAEGTARIPVAVTLVLLILQHTDLTYDDLLEMRMALVSP